MYRLGKRGLLFLAIVFVTTITTVHAGMGSGGGGMGGGGSGTSVIDPPAGANFRDPANATDTNPDPNIVEVNLDVRMAPINVNGVTAKLFTYNGQFPGPTIWAKQGDIVKIHFSNSLPNTGEKNILGFVRGTTNLHTHGWHVSPEEPADAAHLSILPGETYDYEYNHAFQESSTINFYHAHSHGLVAEQHWGGLGGTLIEADSPATAAILSQYETHIMYIKDISLSGNAPTPYTSYQEYMHGKEGNTIMINGLVNPVLTMWPGQVQRWRIVNGCNARFYKLNLQGHKLQIIGTDGGLLDVPYEKSEILLAPGERVDLLVKASETKGTFKLLSLPYSRGGMSTPTQITLMTVQVKGSGPKQTLPKTVNPDAVSMRMMDTSMYKKQTFTLSMMKGRGYINGMDFDVTPYTAMSTVGTYEVWTINNPTMMDHPFHQHVNPAQILSITGGDASYASFYTTTPSWKDTVIVPKGGSVVMLVPVKDYTGMTMFHCHILEHEDIGMMGMWHITDEPMPM